MSGALRVDDGVVADIGTDVRTVVDEAVGADPNAQQHRCTHSHDRHGSDTYATGEDGARRQMCVILHDAVVADYAPLIDDDIVADDAAWPDGCADQNVAAMTYPCGIGNGRGPVDYRRQDEAHGRDAFKNRPPLFVRLGPADADEGVSRPLRKQTLQAFFSTDHRNAAADMVADGQSLIGAALDVIAAPLERIARRVRDWLR